MMKKKVLIVDDDTRNIFALSAVMRSRSYECISCLSAREALRILNSDEHFDVILLDMMMPDIDGYDALPLIKEIPNRQSTPVIAVTAQAMIGDREKCLEAGADDYISKPVDVDKLFKILSHL